VGNTITQTAAVNIAGPVAFDASNAGSVTLTTAGNVFGSTVAIATGFGSDANITSQNTIKLGTVAGTATNTGNGSLTVTSTTGDITQAAAITVAQVPTAGLNLTANAGSVDLYSTGFANSVAGTITIAAKNNSGILTTGKDMLMGNVTVTSGNFAMESATANAITQVAGSKLSIYGDMSVKNVSAATTIATAPITLNNVGNSFGGLWLLGGGGDSSPISITEDGNLKLYYANGLGANSLTTVTLTSRTGTVGNDAPATVSALLPGLPTTSTAAATSYAINSGGVSIFKVSAPLAAIDFEGYKFNKFGTLYVDTPQNVTYKGDANIRLITVQRANAVVIDTSLNGNSNTITLATDPAVVGAGFFQANSVTATTKNALIADDGTMAVTGNVILNAGTGDIQLYDNNNSFGGIQFTGKNVTITENATTRLINASVATGDLYIKSAGDIITAAGSTQKITGKSTLITQLAGNITLGSGWMQLTAANSGKIYLTTAGGFANLGALSFSVNALGGVDSSGVLGVYTPPTP
jgi:uncharacterized protein YuzE